MHSPIVPASLRVLAPLLLCACAHDPETRAPDATSPASTPPRFPDARTLLWEPNVKNAYPRWSNDGARVLYQTNRSGKWQIRVMDADGSHSQAITDGRANDNFPDWSPDNRSVAFVSDRDGNEEIYVMRMDGSGLQNLSNHPARDIHPYWSPDGRKLLFNSTRDADRLQIYEVSVDGTGLRRLVDSPDDDTCARIAPAGDRFVYLANLAVGQDDVLLRKRDGSEPINLTHDRTRDGWPTWTPDGRRIVYSSAPNEHFRLFAMDADGSRAQPITSGDGAYDDARASVSPDLKRIVFNRDDGETIGICVIDLPPEGSASTK
jgi:Tol biopolymer transport system component